MLAKTALFFIVIFQQFLETVLYFTDDKVPVTITDILYEATAVNEFFSTDEWQHLKGILFTTRRMVY